MGIMERTGEHQLLRSAAGDRPTVGGNAGWTLDVTPYVDELNGAGRRYRGCRRAVRHIPAAAVIATLLIAAALLLVLSPLSHHGGAQPAVDRTDAGAVAPVTYQADAPANTLFGTAKAESYPGASDGVIVQMLGNWGKAIGEGALRINDVVVPVTGVYALTVYYVISNNEPTRSVVITASGFGSVSVTVAGNATCCSSQLVRVALNKGTNSITFSNQMGRAPAIDRIVVGPPLPSSPD
jgi:alpha-galactosidase